MPAPLNSTDPGRAECQLVLELLDVARGNGLIEEGARRVATDIVMHMDHWPFQGRNAWRMFIGYLRYRVREQGLTLTHHGATIEGQIVQYRGHFDGGDGGPGNEVVAAFRVENGQVVELWTHRKNYLAAFGQHFATNWGSALVAARCAWWMLRPKSSNRAML